MAHPEYIGIITIVRPDQKEWLDKNIKIFERSKFIRKLLDKHIKKVEKNYEKH